VKYALENCPIFATVTDSATGITTTYDSIGRLIGCEKKVNGETVLRTYQEFNEHNQQTHYGYQIGDESYSESYTYNADGTLNQIVGNDGRTVTMSYDELRRLGGKTVKQGDTAVVSYAYSYRDISETATTTQIASVQVTAANTTTSYAYTYDSCGNILSVSDGTNTTSYVYDSMNQLVRENNQAANKTWVWTYDNAGNIQSKSEYAYTTGELGEAVDMISYGYTDENWSDLLTSYDGNTITYDEIGNPLNDGTWEYTWEHGRELSSMTDGETTWNFTYDANGMRTSRTDGTTTYNYVYNGDSLVQMTVGNDVLYFTSDTVTYNNTVYYYVTNLQGDIVAILNSSGTAVVQYTYDAWGNTLSIDGTMADTLGVINPIRYRGYVYDSESELYYLQSRYYDPELGRFLNADAFASTGQGILGNNMFAYCLGNPINRTDGEGSVSYDCMDDDADKDNNPFNDVGGGSGGGNGSGTQAAGTKANPFIGGSYQSGQGSGNSGKSNYQPPSGGGGVSNSITVNGVTVDFGHGGRHIGEGYDYLDIESVIAQDVMKFPRVSGSAKYVNIVYDSRPLLYVSVNSSSV